MPSPAPRQARAVEPKDLAPEESVTKRMHYGDWLTESPQAQEMSMKVNKQILSQKSAPPAEDEITYFPAAKQTSSVPPPAPVVATELAPPADTNNDVMQLLSPDDLMTAPAVTPPPEKAASVPPQQDYMAAPQPPGKKTKPAKVKAKKSKPPAPPKEEAKAELKAEPKTEEKSAPEKIPEPAPAPEPAVKEEAFTGFGSDIPLAFAMEQILPAGYTFDFAEGVDAEKRVSWQGGKPWRDLISDILAPLNLTSRLEGKTLYVTKKS